MEQARKSEILGLLVKEFLLQKKVSICAPNEFSREMSKLAKKFGVEVEELLEIVVPVLTELFSAMVTPMTKKPLGMSPKTGLGIPGTLFTTGQPGFPSQSSLDAGKAGD
ncbi:MAG: hypothetical protein WC385_00505 [Candidatus Paceibacterota bacterium]|jgi:hypothetical protein